MQFSLKKAIQVSFTSLMIACSMQAIAQEPKLTPEQTKLKKVYESKDIRGGLIGLCKSDLSKEKALNATEAAKFCTCQIDAKGKESLAEQWTLQSLSNAKDEAKIKSILTQKQDAFKKCLGPNLAAKMDKMAQDAYAAAVAEQQKKQAGK